MYLSLDLRFFSFSFFLLLKLDGKFVFFQLFRVDFIEEQLYIENWMVTKTAQCSIGLASKDWFTENIMKLENTFQYVSLQGENISAEV